MPLSPYETLSRLHAAATLRDVYSIEFPLVIAPLDSADDFSGFRYESDDLFRTRGEENTERTIEWDRIIPPAITPVLQSAHMFEQEFSISARQKWDADIHGPLDAYNHGITQSVHVDGAHIPKMRVYFASNKNPTSVVSHEDSLRLYERYAPSLLDRPMDSEFLQDFMMANMDLSDHFRRIASRVPENHLCAMTGVTQHFRAPVIEDSRVFFRARVFGV